ncbi:MAG TPA: TM2 domain-containing protein [Actinomycetes bacterium]|nr:TM2 domain-containing protein [Actinomycetes bacterium]
MSDSFPPPDGPPPSDDTVRLGGEGPAPGGPWWPPPQGPPPSGPPPPGPPPQGPPPYGYGGQPGPQPYPPPPYGYPPPGYPPPGYPGYPGYAGGYVDPLAKSKLAAGLLGIFLGGFGVHRFYLGYTSIGIIQIVVTIFTCGIGSLWGFVEGILYLAGANGWTTDASGRPLKE